jgi:argininosuccinate lyase
MSSHRPDPPSPTRLWGGRFEGEPSAEMDRLNRSLPIDRRLWREDIEGSLAWADGLSRARVLTDEEAAALREGLGAVARRLEAFSVAEWSSLPDEDIHSLVERLLREELGPVAGKLHTGRSRNDQVATDTRLWAMRATKRMEELLADLQRALVGQADSNVATVMPSYTHLQRAQPVSAAQWLLSHAWALARDRDRMEDAGGRIAVLPLGSGAIAGCPFPVDREGLRAALGFAALTPNSIDAVGDRDWLAELLSAAAILGVHLSRLAEDLILFTSAEFGFVRLSDTYSTGSSLMPQKRNPDAMELARGKAGRLIGNLMGVLTLLKGLPTGYNKDLQEDKEALFDTIDTLYTLLPAITGSVSTMRFDAARCAAAVDAAMLATDLADHLVRAGVPFRQAHEIVGRLVRAAEAEGGSLADLPPERFATESPAFEGVDLKGLFDPRRSLASRDNPGGTGPDSVRDQLEALRATL